MTIRKFLAPNALLILILGTLWATGVDTVYVDANSDQSNLQKYLSVQRRILDNYVEKVDIDLLFKDSIKGFVSDLSDSTLSLSGTVLDTTFTAVKVGSIRESILAFEKAYRYLKAVSPEEDLSARTEDAIVAMFDHLDPHSIYIEPETGERIREEFAGKFQGIGVQFDIVKDTIIVVTALVGGPSERLGIQSGDRIIEIEGETSIGFTNRDVINKLRGPKGSIVNITIYRPSRDERLSFDIERDDIPLYTVESSYMLDDKTGYIKVSRFAATTYDEFKTALDELRTFGMNRLVLDLRNNPGGYMDQAIKMANEFFPRNVSIVSSKSRHSRFSQKYFSYSQGSFQNEPLIILVNEGSASASEIVSGAVQDNDRGLIVGARTFGKGLVQQQYELADGSAIRVTISRYYTPSGRLIQKPYSNGREDYAYELTRRPNNPATDAQEFIGDMPDSLKFETSLGRPVYAGGGILPDHIIEDDTTRSYLFGFMRRKRAATDFIVQFVDENGETFKAKWEENFSGYRNDFKWDKSQLSSFDELMAEKGLIISDTVSNPHYTASFDTLYMSPKQREREQWIVEEYLRAELATRIWGTKSFWTIFNDAFDVTLKRAMELWPEVDAIRGYAENMKTKQRRG